MFAPTARTMLAMQIVATAGFIAGFFLLTPMQWVYAFLMYMLFTTVSGVTYHRLLSHKSFIAPKWFEYSGSLIGCLGLNGSPIAWVATHREHHRYTDLAKDPHSPHTQPWWKVQFLSMYHTVNLRYVPDLLRSKFHLQIHKLYWAINLVYAAFVLAAFGPAGLLWAYLIPSLGVWHAGSAINTVNHMFGYRSNVTKDLSTNNLLTGYLVAGEGWHNNHHAAPADAQFGKRWFEFDLGYWLVKAVRK